MNLVNEIRIVIRWLIDFCGILFLLAVIVIGSFFALNYKQIADVSMLHCVSMIEKEADLVMREADLMMAEADAKATRLARK